jgi:hypothetical protein
VRPDPDTYAYGQELSVLHSFIETESPEVAESYTDALRRLLDLAGYDIVVEGRDEWGSWLKRMVVRARRSEAPRRLAEGLAQATHDSYLRQPAASATRDLAEAARTALDAMGEHEGCQVFDNLIVVKRRGQDGQFRSFARELSLDERRVLRERPSIIEHPASVLSELERQTMELKPGSEPMGQLGEWPEQGTPPGLPLAKGD